MNQWLCQLDVDIATVLVKARFDHYFSFSNIGLFTPIFLANNAINYVVAFTVEVSVYVQRYAIDLETFGIYYVWASSAICPTFLYTPVMSSRVESFLSCNSL